MALNVMGQEDLGAGAKSVALQARHFQTRLGVLEEKRWLYTLTTTDATATAMTADAENEALVANTSYGFRGVVVGRKTDGTTGVYLIQGAVKIGAAAANTALVGTPLVTAYEDNAAYDLTVTADTTNGKLQLTATGAAASTIGWRAEVTFVKLA